MAINAQAFLEALNEIEALKGVSKDIILESLKEAMMKGYRKQLGADDALVRVEIDPISGTIEMYQIQMVVAEVEDDLLEISLEDAQAVDKKYQIGDEFLIPASIDDLRKATAMNIKSILKQKVAEAEKSALYETFKDKIGTMITGKVEKVDDRGVSVNIVKTSVFLPRTAMIGDEKFEVGDTIKLYVSDVASGTKGAHIIVSRANEGFLKSLFFEEIHDIYDGTIIIKAIARFAGKRSKVAVYSNDPNVDPAGACIGPNGSKIQKIVSQLGNGQSKEKIDVIAWSENPALFIMESLKPAQVIGINIEEGEKKATAIVDENSFFLAIGKVGINTKLAVRLTGYKIDIKTEEQALEEGISFKTFEEIQAEEVALKAQRIREAQIQATKTEETSVLPGLPEGYVAPTERQYEDEVDEDIEEALTRESEKEETITQVEETPVVEETVEETTPVVEEEVKVTTVETTTTIEDLEKSLEEDKTKTKSKGGYKKFNKKKKEEESEETVKVTPTVDPSTYMSIYTEEELAEMEEEEYEDDYVEDDDIDYDEYDSYYDDEQ